MLEHNLTSLKVNLEQKGYIVNIFDTKESAANYIDNQINEKTVGLGGSVTIQQMNLFAMLSKHNIVYWHDEKPADMTAIARRESAEIYQYYGTNRLVRNMRLF